MYLRHSKAISFDLKLPPTDRPREPEGKYNNLENKSNCFSPLLDSPFVQRRYRNYERKLNEQTLCLGIRGIRIQYRYIYNIYMGTKRAFAALCLLGFYMQAAIRSM